MQSALLATAPRTLPAQQWEVCVYDNTLNADAYITSRRKYTFEGKNQKEATAQAKRNYRRDTGCKNPLRADAFLVNWRDFPNGVTLQ